MLIFKNILINKNPKQTTTVTASWLCVISALVFFNVIQMLQVVIVSISLFHPLDCLMSTKRVAAEKSCFVLGTLYHGKSLKLLLCAGETEADCNGVTETLNKSEESANPDEEKDCEQPSSIVETDTAKEDVTESDDSETAKLKVRLKCL